MATSKARIDSIHRRASQAQADRQFLRREYDLYWIQFTDEELSRIVDGDPAALSRAWARGGKRIIELGEKVLSKAEKKALRRIERELLNAKTETVNND